MRLSKNFTKTTKSVPADEVAKNAQLLIKAGFIHKEMAGVYSYLPLGLRVLNKIAQIVREEMNQVDGQEVLMPALQVKERYEATNRWSDEVVDNWFKTRLANGTELGLGFSHEENLVPIVKNFISSYKDLPLAVYQIQNKFRNEVRSKSGIMRGREFLMKDMYSFALDQKQHDAYYERAANAYERVYKRLGIGDTTVKVMASGGVFSKYSHEFQTFSDAGEDLIFKTSDGQYYNREIAPSKVAQPNKKEAPADIKEVLGRGVVGVEALLKHLGITIERSTKTLFYVTNQGEVIVAAVRSDYDVNELKLADVAGCSTLKLADEQEVKQFTGATVGFAGLLNLPEGLRLFVDDSLKGLCNFETGANKTDYHAVNANFGRDVPEPKEFFDIKIAKQGDLDPATGEPMVVQKAIEVGNIFSLGTKFSAPFKLAAPDEKGELQTLVMGCYGIGVSRLMGTIAEVMSDERGLVWPAHIAPAIVYLARLGEKPEVVKAADELYKELIDQNIEVIYDDRDARPGEKFADADLLGVPYRVVVGDKLVAAKEYELKARTSDKLTLLNKTSLLAKLIKAA
ncbi:MAG TPA: proline--tRNA ligase [Magnetospirillaceae bacterium]|nr:proline--tRNA ligase [Magnetospirillaceae bacterium]